MKHLLSSITLLLLSTVAFGQVTNTFSSGETISSSKINANFSFLANAIKNDNITAMMICTESGVHNEMYFYGNCFSTNSEIFTNDVDLKNRKKYKTNYGVYTQNWELANANDNYLTDNAISLSDLFTKKWILYRSTVSPPIINDGYFYYGDEEHIFYKVSSD